jgi:hypothetical protein
MRPNRAPALQRARPVAPRLGDAGEFERQLARLGESLDAFGQDRVGVIEPAELPEDGGKPGIGLDTIGKPVP